MRQERPQKILNMTLKIKIPLLALSLFLGSCQSEQKEIEKKPNVLFILVDDLGYHDLSYTGSEYYETPSIDSLAKKSVVFTQGYASSRVCSPSRASIMLGQHPARHGITDWIGAKTGEDWRQTNRHDKMLPANYNHHLKPDDLTIAEAFKMNDYTTFFAGKWHLGDAGNYPEDHGFDINIGGWQHGSPKGGYFDPYENDKLPNKNPGQHISERLAEETADFIKNHKDKPFFAMLSFYAVHGPIQAREAQWRKFRDKADAQGIADNGFTMESNLPIRIEQDNPIYAGLVNTMDNAVGRVLQALKESGLDQNTIVVFTSDNGGVASGDNYSTSNLPLRGGKGYQWEGGIREPYFIYVPDAVPKQVDYPVTGADFFPTLLSLTHQNLNGADQVDGVDLKPLIYSTGKCPPRYLYWHYPHYGNQGGDPSSIVRDEEWKLIHYYETDSQELYNLKNDPFEENDLAASEYKIKEKLYSELMSYLNDMQANFPMPDPQYDPDKRKKYEQRIREKKLPQLEQEREDILSQDFKPNDNWWGSQVLD